VGARDSHCRDTEHLYFDFEGADYNGNPTSSKEK
jgi:hypothetical protein